MNNRKRSNRCRFLRLWFLTVSQILGLSGAFLFGYYLNGGTQAYFIGYTIGLLISFGGVIGPS